MDAEALSRSRHLNRRLSIPGAVNVHFHLGLRAYERGDLYSLARHKTALAILPEAGEGSLQHLTLAWRTCWLEDSRERALEIAREVVERFPDDPDGTLELGQMLVDLERREDALDVLTGGAQQFPEDADLWYELGLVAEQLERWDVRLDAFKRVWRLEHDVEPEHRLWLSQDHFIAIAEATLRKLPPIASEALGNVAIIVDDYPEQWVVEEDVADPRVLGFFEGLTHAQEHSVDAISEGPARIYLYRWNIERTCGSEEEVAEQVEITVLHEVGHYLGLDEDALRFMGLG